MRVLSRRLANRIALEERRRVMDDWQVELSRTYPFLGTVGHMRRYRKWLEWAGRILVSVFLACLTVAINYVIFVRVLHYQFDLWR